eukprot:g46178.t1
MMNNEFIVPMTEETKQITLFPGESKVYGLPGVGVTTCLRPPLHFASLSFVGTSNDRYQFSPEIPLDILKNKAINMLTEAVQDGGQHTRDPVGGSVEFQFVPVLKLVSTLLIMGIFDDEDVKHILKMIEPNVFAEVKEEVEKIEDESAKDEEVPTAEEEGEAEEAGEKGEKDEHEEVEEPKEDRSVEEGEETKEEELEEGLLQMKLPESVKLQMCKLLQFFCDCELRHRVESIASLADKFINNMQTDQRERYRELMFSFNMSAAETARKTREFRSPPQEQINMLMNFKLETDEEECPLSDNVKDVLLNFHSKLLTHCGIQIEEEEEEEETDTSLKGRFLNLVEKVKGLRKKKEVEDTPAEEEKIP